MPLQPMADAMKMLGGYHLIAFIAGSAIHRRKHLNGIDGALDLCHAVATRMLESSSGVLTVGIADKLAG